MLTQDFLMGSCLLGGVIMLYSGYMSTVSKLREYKISVMLFIVIFQLITKP